MQLGLWKKSLKRNGCSMSGIFGISEAMPFLPVTGAK
jgi:hypothetical protein